VAGFAWATVAVGCQLGSQLDYPAARELAGIQPSRGGRCATTSVGLAGRHSSGTYGAQRPGESGDELIHLGPQPRDFTPWNITDDKTTSMRTRLLLSVDVANCSWIPGVARRRRLTGVP
jgi:hypothetical protein